MKIKYNISPKGNPSGDNSKNSLLSLTIPDIKNIKNTTNSYSVKGKERSQPNKKDIKRVPFQQKKTFSTPITLIGKFPKKVEMERGRGTQLNEYQSQFKAKQWIKNFYGKLSESRFKLSVKNKIEESIINYLEKRLDVIVFRLGFARSIQEARYLIETKKIKVNTQMISNPNFIVEVGSKISTTSLLSYEAKLRHLKLNVLKTPSHLYNVQINNPQMINRNTKGKLVGYLIKNPIESEAFLPYNFPIDKLHCYLNKY